MLADTTTPAGSVGRDAADPEASSGLMMRLITGHFASQVVRAFAELGIADLLAQGPLPAAQVAMEVGADAAAMARLLRGGAALGLVTADVEADVDRALFSPTPLLDTLRRDAPGSLRGLAVALASSGTWRPWGDFVAAVRTGKRRTVAALGCDYFEYLTRTPDEAEAFTAGMDGVTASLAGQVARVIGASSASVAVDVGGATGALLHALLAANAGLRGVVFDRPEVVPAALAAAERAGLSDRVSVVAGDFFETVPEADLYLLKWILHDWDDAACMRILANCRRAMRPAGRVVVVELRLGGAGDPGPAALMDLNMMVMLTGRERTVAEYDALLAAAALRLARTEVLETPFGPWSVIEAERA